MMRHDKVLVMMLAVLVGSLFAPKVSQAKEQATFEYTVTPIFSDTQKDKTLGYFDLLVTSQKKEVVVLEVYNSSKNEKTIKITPTTAGTSTNGTIDYSGKTWPRTPEHVIDFTKIISKEQTVTLKAKEKKQVIFYITPPETAFDGVVLGGFYAQEEINEKGKVADDGIQIKNRFAIIIGCVLRMKDQTVAQNFKIGAIKPDTYGGYFTLNIPIENHAAKILSDYQLVGEILNKAGEKISDVSMASFSMAPQSIYQMPVEINESTLPAGDYTLDLKIMTKNNKKNWKIKKAFTIDASDKARVVKESISADNWWDTYKVIILLVVLILVILVISFSPKKRK